MKVKLKKGQMDSLHANMLREEMEKIIDKYNLSLPDKASPILEISSSLVSCAGKICILFQRKSYKILGVVIKLSYKYYSAYGYERIYRTLLHEMAHWIDLVTNGYYYDDPHRESFKQICASIGGSMNSYLAGLKYSEAADDQFIIGEYRYICNCGAIHVSFKKYKRLDNRFCKKCGTRADKMKIEKFDYNTQTFHSI